jgi:hypothetical protein
VKSEKSVENMARLLVELRDSLTQLSSSLRDMHYEQSAAQRDATLEEVAVALEKIRQRAEKSGSQ